MGPHVPTTVAVLPDLVIVATSQHQAYSFYVLLCSRGAVSCIQVVAIGAIFTIIIDIQVLLVLLQAMLRIVVIASMSTPS